MGWDNDAYMASRAHWPVSVSCGFLLFFKFSLSLRGGRVCEKWGRDSPARSPVYSQTKGQLYILLIY